MFVHGFRLKNTIIMEGEKIMKTEVFLVLLAAIGIMVLMSAVMTIRKIVMFALKKKNTAKMLTLPPGNRQCELIGCSASRTELNLVVSSDFR